MIEILAGNGVEFAFKALSIPAICTYQRQHFGKYEERYEVWELSEAAFKQLCEVNDAEWKDDWGWWRHCEGSNMGDVCVECVINGFHIMAWDGVERERWCDGCEDKCDHTEADVCECYGTREYANLFRYSCDEIGASTEKNFCAITTDLARQNGMSLGELFNKCML